MTKRKDRRDDRQVERQDARAEPEGPYIEKCTYHQAIDKGCEVYYETDNYEAGTTVPFRSIAWGKAKFEIYDVATGAVVRTIEGEFAPVFSVYNQHYDGVSAAHSVQIHPPALLPPPAFQPIPGQSTRLLAIEYTGAVFIDELHNTSAVAIYDGVAPQPPI